MNKNTMPLFILLATTFILSTFIKPYPLSWAVKLLPMLLLIGVAWQALKKGTISGKYFIAGLVFSACGDFILDYNREGWFIFGLAAFFIAHLFYLASLKPYLNPCSSLRLKSVKQTRLLGVLVAYLIFGAVMLTMLIDGLGELLLPVIAYMSVLLLMALATVFSEKSNFWLMLGGLSFVISDSLLGFNKFSMAIPEASFFIMVSYYFAQFALLNGFIKANNQSLSKPLN